MRIGETGLNKTELMNSVNKHSAQAKMGSHRTYLTVGCDFESTDPKTPFASRINGL